VATAAEMMMVMTAWADLYYCSNKCLRTKQLQSPLSANTSLPWLHMCLS